ncbi:MAG: hypothetical protein QXQ30_01595 [Candidatus Pacearchaeota archaeon]
MKNKIISFFSPGKIRNRDLKKLEDFIEDIYKIKERDLKLFEEIENWNKNNRNYYLLLPENFFPKTREREKRKRIKELKLSREKTKSIEIIEENIITPHKLFKEELNKIRDNYKKNDYPYSFLGISWRYGNKNKLIWTTELVEGFLLYKLAKEIIEIKGYFDERSIEEFIRRDELQKLKKEYKIYKLTKPIEEIGGIITAKVPSRTQEKFYNVHIKGVPLEKWSIWPTINAKCNCDISGWHTTTYIRPKNEEFFCAHIIAAYWAAFNKYKEKISIIPFFLPTKKLENIYLSLKKNVFIEYENNKKPLSKTKIEIMLNRAILLNYCNFYL